MDSRLRGNDEFKVALTKDLISVPMILGLSDFIRLIRTIRVKTALPNNPAIPENAAFLRSTVKLRQKRR